MARFFTVMKQIVHSSKSIDKLAHKGKVIFELSSYLLLCPTRLVQVSAGKGLKLRLLTCLLKHGSFTAIHYSYLDTSTEVGGLQVEDSNIHFISALQMNISGTTEGLKNCIKFLLKGFIERTRPDVFPCPTFVALQGKAKITDGKAIQQAFDKRERGRRSPIALEPRRRQLSGLTLLDGPASGGVRLLYNRNVVFQIRENILRRDDFFENDVEKRDELFKRITGGLFRHTPSKHNIVAISYNGISGSTLVPCGMTYLKGRNLVLCS